MPERLATFRGTVQCARAAGVPRLTLSGSSSTQAPGEPTTLAFNAAAPVDLPPTLEDAAVDDLGGGEYRVGAGARAWLISSAAVHLHRDVGAPFYRAIPPRPTPWAKRVFWRAVLALAASRAGFLLLKAMRR
jgi:hypothetical protein